MVASDKGTNKFDSKLAKDLVLAIWLIFLLLVGILAVQGKASSMLINLNLKQYLKLPSKPANPQSDDNPNNDAQKPPQPTNSKNGGNPNNDAQKPLSQTTPLEVSQKLQDYLAKTYANEDPVLIPPVPLILDRLQLNLNWRDPVRIGQENASKKSPTDAEYESYFESVIKRLELIATYSPVQEGDSSTPESAKSLQIRNDIVPTVFRGAQFQETDIPLPPEAVLWVQLRKRALIQKNNQLSLLDTFVLLIILGGFGSWIFLVRSHLDPDKKTIGLRAYVYRPLLGMALALAVFIVDVSLHSVVSTAKIDQIRRETLILLAFAAGLLSEKTYKYVEDIAGKGIEDAETKSGKKGAEGRDKTPNTDLPNPQGRKENRSAPEAKGGAETPNTVPPNSPLTRG